MTGDTSACVPKHEPAWASDTSASGVMYSAVSRMQTSTKLTFWPALNRGWRFRRIGEQARRHGGQPLAVLWVEGAQLKPRAPERSPVSRQRDQRDAPYKNSRGREVPGVHDVVKPPAATHDQPLTSRLKNPSAVIQ
jgi:hypothetical protein